MSSQVYLSQGSNFRKESGLLHSQWWDPPWPVPSSRFIGFWPLQPGCRPTALSAFSSATSVQPHQGVRRTFGQAGKDPQEGQAGSFPTASYTNSPPLTWLRAKQNFNKSIKNLSLTASNFIDLPGLHRIHISFFSFCLPCLPPTCQRQVFKRPMIWINFTSDI